ncbi:MAG: hypothetical protein LBG76_02705 [Treponema sp.]|nr:hypothetical protein [Treponema sp.]
MDAVVFGINDFFKTAAPNDYKIVISRFPRYAVGFIRSYYAGLKPGTRLRVYAVGGDGMIFDCLNGMMGLENAELAVIPYGHTNNFIKGFGKKAQSLFRNIALQYTAKAIPLDVMRSGDVYALNYGTVGIESLAVFYANRLHDAMDENKISQWFKRRFYTFLYYLGAINVGLNQKILRQKYDITIDGVDFGGDYHSIHIGNGSWYGEKLHPVESAMPDDGELDVLVSSAMGLFKILRLIVPYLHGKYHKYPRVFTLTKGRKIEIRSNAPMYICFDDIIFMDYRLTVELLPGAVNFVDVTNHGYLRFTERRDM